MQPNDIYKLTSVGDPQLSPDGRHVAFVVSRVDEANNTYSSQIWVVGTEPGSRPRALTGGEHRDSGPRWSPDGTQIAFSSSRKKDGAGKTKSTLHLLPFEVPGETVLLASGDEGFGDLAFSPDGTMLALTHRRRGDHYQHDEVSKRPARKIDRLASRLNGEGFTHDRPNHVHVVSTDGTRPLEPVTAGRVKCSAPCWFPNGQRLAVGVDDPAYDFAEDVGIVSARPDEPIDPKTGPLDDPPTTIERLTEGTGIYQLPAVSPDGSRVVVIGMDDVTVFPQTPNLGVLEPGPTATPRWFTKSFDRNWWTGQPQFIDSNTVLAGFEDRGNTHLAKVDVDTGAVTPVVEGDLTVTGWSTGTVAGAEAIAYTATTATTPAELYLSVGGETRQLTSLGDGWLKSINPQGPEHFLAPSGDVEVDAWIIRPYDFDPDKKYPALVNVHGGPYGQYGNFLFDEFQMQARAGYVVIYSNPRGGSGRGEAWAQAILGPKHKVPGSGWGGADYNDVMAVTNTAIDKYDFIDPDRLGVLGGSYGGYMTSWIMTHSDQFAAGCSERAANNLLSLEYGSDIGAVFFSEIGPRFVDDPDEYLRMSPITYIKNLNAPFLIIHSEDDLRCPADQAWQMFNACRVLDKADVEFWLFPGENHELSRSGSPSHRIQRAEIILDFFGRHLAS